MSLEILMISRDPQILSPGSAVEERMREYAHQVKRLVIIVLHRKPGLPKINQIAPQVIAINAYQGWPALSFLKAYYLTVQELKKMTNPMITVQDPFETALIGWVVATLAHVPWQVQVHTDFLQPEFSRESWVQRVRVMLAKSLVPRATRVRVVTAALAKAFETRGVARERIDVVPVPIVITSKISDSAQLQNERAKYPVQHLAVMVSRLTVEKNVALAITALAELRKQSYDTGLLIVGAGPVRLELERLAKELGVGDYVYWVGWQTDPALFYQIADLCVVTSNYEGYCRTAVEALYYGCPLIVTAVGVAAELPPRCCQVVPVGDKDALIAAWKTWYDTTGPRQDWVRAPLLSQTWFNYPEQVAALIRSWQNCK